MKQGLLYDVIFIYRETTALHIFSKCLFFSSPYSMSNAVWLFSGLNSRIEDSLQLPYKAPLSLCKLAHPYS